MGFFIGDIMKDKKTDKAGIKQGYEVGNKKPPKEYQFRPGQSGNPAGKPPGTVSIVTEIKKKLLEMPIGEKKTFLEIFLQKLFNKVLTDKDTAMMRDLIDRVDGKPPQFNEFKHTGLPKQNTDTSAIIGMLNEKDKDGKTIAELIREKLRKK